MTGICLAYGVALLTAWLAGLAGLLHSRGDLRPDSRVLVVMSGRER